MADRTIQVRGGHTLAGEVTASGAKNASLPCLVATLLSDEPSKISNLPRLSDIDTTFATLAALGWQPRQDAAGTATVTPGGSGGHSVPAALAWAMRASVLALGPLLATRGQAVVPLPGGDNFGKRPVDIHLRGLEAMGAQVELRDGVIHARAHGLKGARLILDYPTFTGTENLLLAATLAQGTTVIDNAAREPEVADLARMLTGMGAHIAGAGTSTIVVEGVTRLAGADHAVLPDRIEAGTYLAAVMATGGEVTVHGAVAGLLELPLQKFALAGAQVRASDTAVTLAMAGQPRAFSLVASPYPGYPTDLQAQALAVNCRAAGVAEIVDQVWPSRFRTADELSLLGADIKVSGNCATVTGKPRLAGAHVQASDLRASAALVLGGLAATGETHIHGIDHLERGYADLPGKLRALGADIEVTAR